MPVPGPSAAIAALSVSGLPTDRFLFVGFLPPRSGARRRALEELARERPTLVLYESPVRVVDCLADMVELLGDRDAFLCREATKVHEEYVRAPLSALRASLAAREAVKGEIVLVVGGAPESSARGRPGPGRALSLAGRRGPHAARGGQGGGPPARPARARGLPARAGGGAGGRVGRCPARAEPVDEPPTGGASRGPSPGSRRPPAPSSWPPAGPRRSSGDCERGCGLCGRRRRPSRRRGREQPVERAQELLGGDAVGDLVRVLVVGPVHHQELRAQAAVGGQEVDRPPPRLRAPPAPPARGCRRRGSARREDRRRGGRSSRRRARGARGTGRPSARARCAARGPAGVAGRETASDRPRAGAGSAPWPRAGRRRSARAPIGRGAVARSAAPASRVASPPSRARGAPPPRSRPRCR